MYYSFAGITEGMGDTQPIETQVFRTASNLGALLAKDQEPEVGGHEPPNATSSPVDLVGSLGEEEEDDIDIEISSIPEDNHTPEAQFRVPKTPAATGRKRDSSGNVVSSVTRTSSSRAPVSALKRMFGDGQEVGNISLTQAFEGTQNVSSPAAALRSDPVFERPSPNFHLDQSSPVAAKMSSQAGLPSTAPNRIPSDPLNTYRTMKESQEERERRLKQDEEDRRRFEEGDDPDDSLLMSVPEEVVRRQRDREKEKNIMRAWSNFLGPRSAALDRRLRSAGTMFSDEKAVTPARKRTGKKAAEHIVISDEIPGGGSDDESEADETEFAPTSVMQVPMTSFRGKSQFEVQIASSPSILPPKRSIYAKVRGTEEEHFSGVQAGVTQKSFAVADSQRAVPMGEIGDEPLPQTQDVTPTQDSETRILQSQYSARVTKPRDTSSVLEPQTKASLIQGNQLPSSPPMKLGEDLQVGAMGIDDSEEEEAELPGIAMEKEKGTSANLENDIPYEEQVVLKAAEIQETSPQQFTILTTVAESDSIESPNYRPPTDLCARQPSGFDSKSNQSGSTSKATTMTNTNATELFDTAHSHLSPSTRTRPTSQVSHATGQSPARSRLRKLTEIAEDPTSQLSLPSMNLDINLLNEDDKEFLDAMGGKVPSSSPASSPVRPAKRRRPNQSKPLSEPAKKVNIVELDSKSSAESRSTKAKAVSTERDSEDSEDDVHEDTAPMKQKVIMKPTVAKNGKLVRPSRETAMPKSKANTSHPSARQQDQKQTTEGLAENSEATDLQLKDLRRLSDAQPDSLPPLNVSSRSDEDRHDRCPPDNNSGNAQDDISVPNRVFAYFGGTFMAYFPATCLGGSHLNGLRVEVRFDDGTVALLERNQIRRLELRCGDLVKIYRKKMRNKTFVVRGFKDRISLSGTTTSEENGSQQLPLTDIQGFQTIVLAPKTRGTNVAENGTTGTIMIPTTDLYLTGNLWPRFADRPYEPASCAPISDRLHTPSEIPSAPGTPSNRSRRQPAKDSKPSTQSFDIFSTVRRGTGLFTNMAFAITLAENLIKEKSDAVKAVLENGGTILDYGFDELFHCTEATESRDDGGERKPLKLKSWARNMGFTALIADCASRRLKYMQALALNLPCVHFRWVADCVKEKSVLPWGKYLLPAGRSAFLSGAVRSRNLTPYDPLNVEARLENVLARRERLLEGKSVLLVTGRRNLEKRKPYEFVTFALGAESVTRVRDLKEARKQIGEKEFDWVYVDGNEKEAEIVVLSEARIDEVGKGKKRKRGGNELETPNGDEKGSEGKTKKRPKFVSDEFVIQSLILGALME